MITIIYTRYLKLKINSVHNFSEVKYSYMLLKEYGVIKFIIIENETSTVGSFNCLSDVEIYAT